MIWRVGPPAIAFVAVLAIGTAAQGEEYESPRHFALELKAGPYLPDVDSDPALSGTPYRDTFCRGEACDDLVFSGFEFDWQILRTHVFSLGVGGGAGFFQAYEKARFEGCFGPDADCLSSEYTVLNVIPIVALGVLRIDALPQLAGIPIVPFGKVGVTRYMWWILSGQGTAKVDGVRGSGWTWGWQAAGGLMLLLDVLEPSAARKLDQESGINNSYLFAEILYAQVDGFGSEDVLILSDTTWVAGLALEF